MKHTIASFIVGALIALAFVGAIAHDAHAGSCQEDMPCWNCATMGNKICGASTTTIRVYPCTIERWNHARKAVEVNCNRRVYLHRAYLACNTQRMRIVYGADFMQCMIDFLQMKGWVR